MQATIDMLSTEAKSALTSGSSRIGAKRISDMTAGHVVRELLNAKLIGANGGLTIRGSAVAEKLQNAQLDELFG